MTVMLFLIAAAVAMLVIFILTQYLIVKCNGQPVPEPVTTRTPQTIGTGKPLTFAVLGDSTAVGQGGDYQQGIAMAAVKQLAEKHAVTFQNVAVSGARIADVLHNQLSTAAQMQPDVVLLAVGANDVTHLTPYSALARDFTLIIDGIYAANPKAKIVITGAPAMYTVPRFPWPVQQLAKKRVQRVNDILFGIAKSRKLFVAPIAEKTGPIFARHPELFAADKFHPATAGYDVWVPVIHDALQQAIKNSKTP